MKILFVVNPKSGNGNEKDIESKLTSFSQKNRVEQKLIYTKGIGDSERIVREMEEFKPSTVVAVGGDGTINLVASLLINRNINLGIIPMGSANGLAYSLNVPNNVEKALLKLEDKKPKPLDAILLNEKYHCFHLSDTGMNARIVKRFEIAGSKGLAGYGKQLIKEIFAAKTTFRVAVKTNGILKKLNAEMVVIANTNSFGTGAKINPLGKPNDGMFEIVVIKPYPWWFIFRLVVSFFAGNLHKLQRVKVFSTSKASLSFEKPQVMQIDGEIVEGVTSLKAEIIPLALNVFY